MAKRGRPTGHRLSAETRRKISQSKLGHHHSEETKQKISNGVRRESNSPISIERVLALDLSKAYTAKVGRYMNVYVPSDGINPGKSMRLHVAIMEQKLGRKLRDEEQVHHWGSKLDNNPDLLTLCKNKKEHNILDRIKKKLIKYLKERKLV